MIRTIKENKNKNCMTLVEECDTEISGLMVSIVTGNLQDLKDRSTRVVQSMVDIWDKQGLGHEEVENMFRDYYIDKMQKGYTLGHLTGESSNEKMIADLMNKLNSKETEVKILKSALKLVCKLKDS